MSDLVDPELVYRGVERRNDRRATYLAVVIIDSAFRVKYSASEGPKGDGSRRLLCDDASRLRPEVVSLVSKLMSTFGPNGSSGRVGLLDENHTVRLTRLVGCEETLFALMVESCRNNDSILRAAGRYQLTRRQCEVLALIIEGASVNEIAEQLCITENTVQGYVKSLLSKTRSRNRPAMVASVLDWNMGRTPKRETLSLVDERRTQQRVGADAS